MNIWLVSWQEEGKRHIQTVLTKPSELLVRQQKT